MALMMKGLGALHFARARPLNALEAQNLKPEKKCEPYSEFESFDDEGLEAL